MPNPVDIRCVNITQNCPHTSEVALKLLRVVEDDLAVSSKSFEMLGDDGW